jgi:hypothetical protein
MYSPFRPVPADLMSFADAAERLKVTPDFVRDYFGRRRPLWLKRWLKANGMRLSPPTMVLRMLKDGRRGHLAYVKASDVALIERARADSQDEKPFTQIVHRGEDCLSVPEFGCDPLYAANLRGKSPVY